jgi:hypothetical protein
MTGKKSWLLVCGILCASFCGGAASHWLLTGPIAAVAAAPPDAPKVVTAQQFKVVNDAGKTLAAFGVTEKGTAALNLFDDGGKLRLTIGLLDKYAPVLAEYDENGKMRLAMSLSSKDGSPLVAQYDAEEKMRAGLAMGADGTVGLGLSGADGKARSAVSISGKGEPTITQHDAKGTLRATLGQTPKGTWALTLYDEPGKPATPAP